MENKQILTPDDMAGNYNTNDVARLAHFLLKEQLSGWPMARQNYKGLEKAQVKRFPYESFNVFSQFNPERIRSSTAKVDKRSIEERPCFLCGKNLPVEQKGLEYKGQYRILVNPFPIFQEHFTIPHKEHSPQLIRGKVRDLLDLSKDMHHYVVFYNGPLCGASAPDHFHFQAGMKGFMPIDYEYPKVKKQFESIYESHHLAVYGMDQYLRHFIALEGTEAEAIEEAFEALLEKMETWKQEPEPMMNILAGYWEGHWRVLVFPRKKHRPEQYYEEGADKLLISPGAVDMGGTLIAPLEKDFEKLGEKLVSDLFSQVTISPEAHQELVEYMKHSLKR